MGVTKHKITIMNSKIDGDLTGVRMVIADSIGNFNPIGVEGTDYINMTELKLYDEGSNQLDYSKYYAEHATTSTIKFYENWQGNWQEIESPGAIAFMGRDIATTFVGGKIQVGAAMDNTSETDLDEVLDDLDEVITTNTTGIATNVTDITALDVRVTALEGEVASNVAGEAASRGDISVMLRCTAQDVASIMYRFRWRARHTDDDQWVSGELNIYADVPTNEYSILLDSISSTFASDQHKDVIIDYEIWAKGPGDSDWVVGTGVKSKDIVFPPYEKTFVGLLQSVGVAFSEIAAPLGIYSESIIVGEDGVFPTASQDNPDSNRLIVPSLGYNFKYINVTITITGTAPSGDVDLKFWSTTTGTAEVVTITSGGRLKYSTLNELLVSDGAVLKIYSLDPKGMSGVHIFLRRKLVDA